MKISLSEAIRKQLIEDLDIVDPSSLLPKKRFIPMERRETGRTKTYYFKREKMSYVFLKENYLGFTVLIGVPNYIKPLKLVGRRGYDYGTKLFHRIANQLYSNSKYGIEATPLKSQDIEILLKNENFKGFICETWIDDKIEQNRNFYQIYGYKYVVGKRIQDNKSLMISDHHNNTLTRAQQNAFATEIWIKNPENILIKKKKNGEWKFILKRRLWLLNFLR